MSLNIQNNVSISSNNMAFKSRGKGVENIAKKSTEITKEELESLWSRQNPNSYVRFMKFLSLLA